MSTPKVAVRVVGGVLALPALVLLLLGYLLPAISTVLQSFQDVNLLSDGPATWVGFENYDKALNAVPGALAQPLLLALVPLLVVLVVAPLLAFAASRAGRAGRWITRLTLTLPLVCYAPTALAVAWRVNETPRTGPGPSLAPTLWLSTFGLICAIGVTLYLAALRHREGEPAAVAWWSAAGVAGMLVLAVLAAMLQVFDSSIILPAPGPDAAKLGLVYVDERAFRAFDFGSGAAMSTVLLIVLALLGVGATVLAIVTGLRVEFGEADQRAMSGGADQRGMGGEADQRGMGGEADQRGMSGEADQRGIGGGADQRGMSGRAPTGRTNVAALVGTGVGLVVVLVIALVGLWPWLSRAGQSAEGLRIPTGTILANTWLPPLLAAILAIVPAALAGFGIGALRPLGRYSELLLLPFAPFLFVGAGPLAIARFEDLQDAKLLDTFVALIPQGWISIPALVIFTLFFRGQQPRLGILPSLPLIGLVGLATWVVGAQDVLWPRLVASDQEHWTGPLTLMSQTFQFANRPDTYAFGLVLPLAVVVVLVVLVGLLQLTYLDRLTIRIGRIAKPAEPPRPSV